MPEERLKACLAAEGANGKKRLYWLALFFFRTK